jgi:hypothetical protein
MNHRVIIIIIAVLLPLATLAFLAQSPSGSRNDNAAIPKPTNAPLPKDQPQTLSELRKKGMPATLAEARERTRWRLEILNRMSDADFEADEQQRVLERATANQKHWENLTPEQQLERAQKEKADKENMENPALNKLPNLSGEPTLGQGPQMVR